MGSVFQFDWEVLFMSWLQDLICNSQLLVYLFYIITQLGSAVLIVCVIAFLYLAYDKNIGRKIAINAIFGSVFNSLIKNIFLRIRPYVINDSVECLFAVEPGYDINDMSKQGYSFPSGHCTNISNVIVSFYRYLKDKRIIAYGSLIIFLVCLSRIIIGVHYPSDTIAGVIVGIVSVFVLDYLRGKFGKKVFYLIVLGFSLLGLFYCDSNDYYSSLGLLIGFTMGDLFEEKYVRFENTNNIKRMIVRTLLALVIFLGISSGLKPLLNHLLYDSSDMLIYLFRTFRYMLATFILIGIYPMIFKYNIFKFEERNNQDA